MNTTGLSTEFSISVWRKLSPMAVLWFYRYPLRKKKEIPKIWWTLIDKYTVDQAVKDKAVVPLLLRRAPCDSGSQWTPPIDAYFTKVSEPLTSYQRSDLKKKFSRADQLNVAEQKYAIAWDISEHYRNASAGTDWKGQLVSQSKAAAINIKVSGWNR